MSYLQQFEPHVIPPPLQQLAGLLCNVALPQMRSKEEIASVAHLLRHIHDEGSADRALQR